VISSVGFSHSGIDRLSEWMSEWLMNISEWVNDGLSHLLSFCNPHILILCGLVNFF